MMDNELSLVFGDELFDTQADYAYETNNTMAGDECNHLYLPPNTYDMRAGVILTEAQALEWNEPVKEPAKPLIPLTKAQREQLGESIKITEDGQILRKIGKGWRDAVKDRSGNKSVEFKGHRIPATKVAYYYYYGIYPTAYIALLDPDKGYTLDNLEVVYNTKRQDFEADMVDEYNKQILSNWGNYDHARFDKWVGTGLDLKTQPSHDALGRTFDSRREQGEHIPTGQELKYFINKDMLRTLELEADELLRNNGGFEKYGMLRPAQR